MGLASSAPPFLSPTSLPLPPGCPGLVQAFQLSLTSLPAPWGLVSDLTPLLDPQSGAPSSAGIMAPHLIPASFSHVFPAVKSCT